MRNVKGFSLLSVSALLGIILIGSYFFISYVQYALESEVTVEQKSMLRDVLSDTLAVTSDPKLCKKALEGIDWGAKSKVMDVTSIAMLPEGSTQLPIDVVKKNQALKFGVNVFSIELRPAAAPASSALERYVNVVITADKSKGFVSRTQVVSKETIKVVLKTPTEVASCSIGGVDQALTPDEYCAAVGGVISAADGKCEASLKNMELIETDTKELKSNFNENTAIFCPRDYLTNSLTGTNKKNKYEPETWPKIDGLSSGQWKYANYAAAELEESCNNFCGGLTKGSHFVDGDHPAPGSPAWVHLAYPGESYLLDYKDKNGNTLKPDADHLDSATEIIQKKIGGVPIDFKSGVFGSCGPLIEIPVGTFWAKVTCQCLK